MQPNSPLRARNHEYVISRPLVFLRAKHGITCTYLHSLCAAVILLLPPVQSANGQIVPKRNYRFERGNFFAQPVPPDALDLTPVHGGRSGKVWLQQSHEGLVIFGKMNGPEPKWARFPLEMNARTHVDLWLAAATKVEMPEIGWGNQFGYADCSHYAGSDEAGSTEECASWSARQVAYRAELSRLFVRRWRMAPTVTTEDFASVAYARVLEYANDFERSYFDKLRPIGSPFMETMHSTDSSFFEIFVRWSDFPPASSLTLSRVYVAAEVFDGGNLSSTTMPDGSEGDTASFKELQLEEPLHSHICPCNYPLSGLDPFKKEHPAWYFPSLLGQVEDVFVIVNDAAGYRNRPDGLSPISSWTHYFSSNLGGGSVVCGPPFTYVVGSKFHYFKDRPLQEPLTSHPLSDGTILLKSGPQTGALSYFGTGACGSCSTAAVSLFHLDPKKGITLSFSESLVLDAPRVVDGDIQLSPDWKQIVTYVASQDDLDKPPNWSSKRYCLTETKYEDCGPGPSGPPPSPRRVIFRKRS